MFLVLGSLMRVSVSANAYMIGVRQKWNIFQWREFFQFKVFTEFQKYFKGFLRVYTQCFLETISEKHLANKQLKQQNQVLVSRIAGSQEVQEFFREFVAKHLCQEEPEATFTALLKSIVKSKVDCSDLWRKSAGQVSFDFLSVYRDLHRFYFELEGRIFKKLVDNLE